MKIAVTGGTGFLGRYLIQELLSKGHSLRLWQRPGSNRSLSAEDAYREPKERLEWVPGELGDATGSRHLVEGTEILIHAALSRSGIGFRGSEGNLEEYLQRNFMGSIKLLEAARQVGVRRVILISTCAVHEKILDDRTLDETHPLWPASHYGAGKAALEAMVHSYAIGQGWEICAIRPCGIYGLAAPVGESKWFNLVKQVARGDDVVVQGGGKEVHAADVARSISLLTELPKANVTGGIFNCCDRYVSQYEVAMFAKELSGSSAMIEGKASQPKHQIDSGKLKRLGFEFGGVDRLRETIGQILNA